MLVTNLHNHTQPLIRYELTDRFIRHPAAADDALLRATVEGRADDTFRYGSIAVDPLVIRTVMVRTPDALEYQVRQTPRGIDVAVVADGELDHATLAASLEQSLRAAGLPRPRARVHQVPDITRHPETGKARRFIPMWTNPHARKSSSPSRSMRTVASAGLRAPACTSGRGRAA